MRLALSAGIGGLLFGYDTGDWTSFPIDINAIIQASSFVKEGESIR